MAFTANATYTNWGSSASVSSMTFTGQQIDVGEILVIAWCANVASLTYTISDNSTQPGDANIYTQRPLLNATTFTSGTCYCLRVTRQILTTDTITITLTGGPVTRSAAIARSWIPGNGNAQLENRSSVANDTTSPVAAPVMSTTQWQSNELGLLYGFWKGGAVGAGFSNSSTNMTGAGTGTSALSGGVTTRVEVNVASTVALGLTAWGPSASYTSITVANVEGLTFTDRATNSTACRQYHSMPRGTALSSITAEIGPCVAGNLLILAVATNENAGADNITTPGGWTLAGTFRQGTTDINIAVFTKIAAGGETTQAITTSAAQRVLVHWSEWVGFSATQDGSPSTSGSTVGVTTLGTGTVTPTGSGRLYFGFVVEKNAGPLTAGGTVTTEQLVNNEAGANSTQKEAGGVYIDDNRSTAASSAPTVGTASGYAGMAFLFLANTVTTAFAPGAAKPATQTPWYRAPISRMFGAFTPNAPVVPDNWVPGVLSRASPFYTGSPPSTMGGIGPSPPQDWVQGAANRPTPYYRGARPMAVVVPTPVADQDDWTPSVLSRRSSFYLGSRAFTVMVSDTPAVAADVFVPPVSSRAIANYRGSYSLNVSAADEEIGLWADFNRSRQLPPYAGRSGIFAVYDTPAAPVADTWAGVIYSQLRLPPPASRSLVQPPLVVDQDEWAQVVYSRQGLAGPIVRQQPVSPGITTNDGWASSAQSPPKLNPRVRSFIASVYANAAVAATDNWAQVIQSRPLKTPEKRNYYVLTIDDHACSTLYPDTMLGPDNPMLFPDLCPVLDLRLMAQGRRGVSYVGSSSVITNVYADSGTTGWTTVFQARARRQAQGGLSQIILIAPSSTDAYAAVYQASAMLAPKPQRGSRAVSPLTVAQAPADGYAFVAIARGTIADAAVRSIVMMPFSEGIVIVTPTNPGGGGEWVIWTRPEFPGYERGAWKTFDKPQFRKPTRRVP